MRKVFAGLILCAVFCGVFLPEVAKATITITFGSPSPAPSPTPTPTASPTPVPAGTPSPVPTATASPNTWYLSPTGSDSNAGTGPNIPFLTFQKALSSLTTTKRWIIAAPGSGGSYTGTSSTNSGSCSGGCLGFVPNVGTNVANVIIQCQQWLACNLNGTSPATGTLYAFTAANSASYVQVIGFNYTNFVGGAFNLNAAAGGAANASKANHDWVINGFSCTNIGLTCVLGGAYSGPLTIENGYADYIGSYSGFTTCPGSNANDHGVYLQDQNMLIENVAFGSHILCGWPVQMASDTPGHQSSLTMINVSVGDRSHVVAPSTYGIIVLYDGVDNITPSANLVNIAAYNSTGAYIACYNQTVTGNPTIGLSYSVLGDNNSLTNCLGTYTFNTSNLFRNTSPGFLVSPPSSSLSDFKIPNLSALCNHGTTGGPATDVAGIPRPNLFTNPDIGVYSCNSY